MAARSTPLFVGARGTVIAVDRATGDTIWTADLKGGEFVEAMIVDGDLFAASKGRLYRLDPATGDVLWRNDLPGLGWGIVTIAGARPAAAAETVRRDRAAAAAAAPA
ncbi:MAG TPA: PQQ-binding-like beta-propeller repeat protein [Vicinamibacterales bacterium]|jgi:outer membrane protein assembly factor BamB